MFQNKRNNILEYAIADSLIVQQAQVTVIPRSKIIHAAERLSYINQRYQAALWPLHIHVF